MLNTKALSLAVGSTFAIMVLLQAILAYVVGVNIQIPNVSVPVDAGTAFATIILATIFAFVYGAILGAVAGGIYNATVKKELGVESEEEILSYQ